MAYVIGTLISLAIWAGFAFFAVSLAGFAATIHWTLGVIVVIALAPFLFTSLMVAVFPGPK